MLVDLYTVVYNEEYLLPYFIKWYKERIPNVRIHIYDNGSTDNTKKIAEEAGCIVHDFESGGFLRDDLLLEFKNNIWKGSDAYKVIVVDPDEFLSVTVADLSNNAIISSIGYDMVGTGESPDQINQGVRNSLYDKTCIFDPKTIREINYGPGCHTADPIGFVMYGSPVILYHMKYLSEDRYTNKTKELASRLSQQNIDNKWGFHFAKPEEELRALYQEKLSQRVKIR